MRRAGLFAFAVTIVAGSALAQSPSSPDDIIAQRQAGQKQLAQTFAGMKKGIDSGADVTQYVGPAKDMAAWAVKFPTLFPPGTETGHNTHATPAVWSDRATFNADAQDLVVQLNKLQQVAATGDKAAFAEQWQATGKVCGSCHANEKFRTRI